MAKFSYKMCFSPYTNILRAKNYRDAWKKLKELWPEYNVKKVVLFLYREYSVKRY